MVPAGTCMALVASRRPGRVMLPTVREMTLRLTDEARAGWDRACRTTGVTLTALVEAIGRDLHESSRLLERGADLIEAARGHRHGTTQTPVEREEAALPEGKAA